MFLSVYENKLDKKGRVSVPASYRSHLSNLGYNGIICYPSFNYAALEACTQSRIEKLSSPGGICISSNVYDQLANKNKFIRQK